LTILKNKILILTICIIFKSTTFFGQNNQHSINTILENIYKDDQNIRADLIKAYSKTQIDSKEIDSLTSLMIKIDKENQLILDSIFLSIGFPKKNYLSDTAYYGLFLCLQHSDKAFRKKHETLIKNAVDQGYMKIEDYALFIDRNLTNEDELQIYGTQQVLTDKGKSYLLPPINGNKLIKNRRKVGLPTLSKEIKNQLDSFNSKNKNFLKTLIIVQNLDGSPVKDVNLQLGNGVKIGSTNDEGIFRAILPSKFLNYYIIFSKDGYTTFPYKIDGKGILLNVYLTKSD